MIHTRGSASHVIMFNEWRVSTRRTPAKKEARQHGVVMVRQQSMQVSIYELATRPTNFDSPMAVS